MNRPADKYKQPVTLQRHRYVVTYESEYHVLTFSVFACRPSEATALVIQFIDEHKIHTEPGGFTLIPRVENNSRVTYKINEK